MATTKQKTDLIELITADHRALERVFADLENGWGGPEYRRQLVDHVLAELARHAVTTEKYLHPLARKKLPRDLVDSHHHTDRQMTGLENLSPANARFEQLLGKLISDVREHIELEEAVLLPRLRAACSAQDLRECGRKVLQAAKLAPVSPHPSSPDRLLSNPILVPGMNIVDEVRAALDKPDLHYADD
jgi:hemerythrin superfamily protein